MESLEIKKELQELKQITLLGSKRVLTMQDVSLLTGLSMSCLYKKTSNKEIPFWKSSSGKITYFDKSEIENWCLFHRIKTVDELDTEATNYIVTGNARKGGNK